MEIEKETLLLVIVYYMSGHLELLKQRRVLVIGDFNLDQMFTENVTRAGIKIHFVFF